jgi:hypothetical protein
MSHPPFFDHPESTLNKRSGKQLATYKNVQQMFIVTEAFAVLLVTPTCVVRCFILDHDLLK